MRTRTGRLVINIDDGDTYLVDYDLGIVIIVTPTGCNLKRLQDGSKQPVQPVQNPVQGLEPVRSGSDPVPVSGSSNPADRVYGNMIVCVCFMQDDKTQRCVTVRIAPRTAHRLTWKGPSE